MYNTLKEKLVKTGCFEDNVYFDKYISLIVANRDTKRIKYSTQKHHIIPKAYYQHVTGTPVDNSKNNVVTLLYKDHILAHYYMSLCTTGTLKFMSTYALKVLLSMREFNNEHDLIIELPELQKLYEEIKTQQSTYFSKILTGVKKGNGHEGKKFMHKDGLCICVSPEEFEIKLSEGYVFGRLMSDSARKNIIAGQRGSQRPTLRVPKTEEHKLNLSKSIKGRIPLTDGTSLRWVFADSEECLKLRSEGWRDRLEGECFQKTIKGRIYVYNESETLLINKDDLTRYLDMGYVRGRKRK